MNKNILFVLIFTVFSYSYASQDKTEALHMEAKNHKNPNITQETHPVLYDMVRNLVIKANVAMPKYITTHGAEHSVVTREGLVYKTASNMTAWTDVLGDLHICHEILTDLSYDEVEGIVAIAIAEKAINKPGKLAMVGVGTFALTATSIYFLNKYFNLGLGSFLGGHRYSTIQDREDRFVILMWLTLAPALLATKLTDNNLQKLIDTDATKLKDVQQIIAGIKSLSKLEETYIKEGFFSRIANALKLKSIYNTIFYPIRAFTLEERVQYLEDLKNKNCL